MGRISDDNEIKRRLTGLPEWRRDGEALVREMAFDSWQAGVDFVNLVARLAQEQDHHPDIWIGWRKVSFHLSSHDSGGITERDFRLAHAIQELRGK